MQPQEEMVEISNAEPGAAGCSLRRKWWTPARPSECAALGGNGSMGAAGAAGCSLRRKWWGSEAMLELSKAQRRWGTKDQSYIYIFVI